MKRKHFIFFFLDNFHRGVVNHLMHFIGFTVLGYGMGSGNIILIILSPFVMELGHFYNYYRGIHRDYAVKIIPYQWLAWIVFVAIGYGLTKLFQL